MKTQELQSTASASEKSPGVRQGRQQRGQLDVGFGESLSNVGTWLMAVGIFDESVARLPTYQRVDERRVWSEQMKGRMTGVSPLLS